MDSDRAQEEGSKRGPSSPIWEPHAPFWAGGGCLGGQFLPRLWPGGQGQERQVRERDCPESPSRQTRLRGSSKYTTRALLAARRSPYRLWLTPQRPRDPRVACPSLPAEMGTQARRLWAGAHVQGEARASGLQPPSCPACSGADGQMAQCPPLASFFSHSLTSRPRSAERLW